MSIPQINSSDISNQILNIFKGNSNNRKGRIETLNQISDLAKGIIDNLNNIDDSVAEIMGDLENFNEEYESLMLEIEETNYEFEKYSNSSESLEHEIAALEEKEKNGSITEEEVEKLNSLRAEQQVYLDKSNSVNKNLAELTNSSNSMTSKMTNYSEELENISTTMEEYQKAGTVIKESANKYGKKNMNCEKAMDRNESSWWGNAAKYSLAGGVFSGFFGQGKQTQKYLDKAGYEEIGNNSQVFYDAENHDYIAEYDVLEKKGGNQIGGKMRKATAKTFSYGKTIEVASQNIEQNAKQTKSKLNKPENETN